MNPAAVTARLVLCLGEAPRCLVRKDISQQQIEELTVRLGNEMFDRMERNRPWVFQSQWWQEQMLQLLMKDERLKVQAFRFIDVLPAVGNHQTEMARHMKEYFAGPDLAGGTNEHPDRNHARQAALKELERANSQDRLVRLAAKVMNFHRLDSFWARLLCWVAWNTSRKMAGTFIAGTNPQEAEQAIRHMRKQQLAFTIDVLGEAAVSRKEAEAYQQIYLDLLTELPKHAAVWPTVRLIDEFDGEPIPRVNVSVKLTAIHPGLDAIAPEQSKNVAKERLRPILRRAMEAGAHIHIDMEHYAIKELTLAIFRELLMESEFRDYPHFGAVLQAYLKDGDRDVHEIVDWAKRRGTPVWVRLVKGAYWDSETVWADQAGRPWPVWEQKWQSDACFERMTRVLLENWRYTPSAFGSHNIRSLAYALALRQLLEVPGTAFELQMLYGMGDPIKRAGVEMSQRCRIYTPYGELLPGMAYFIRRLLENTANESFLRQTADVPREELLKNPERVGAATPPYEKPLVFKCEFEEPIMDPFENVPNSEFAHEEHRQKMRAALADARAAMGVEYPLIINGKRVTTGRWRESLNPSRPSEVVGRVAQADADAVERAVGAAAEAFDTWRRVAPHERAEYLFKVATLMQEHRFDLAALEALECGKPWREADADVSEAIDYCNYYGKEMVRMSEHARRRDIPGETNEYVYASRGVVAVISPWNFPLAILAGMTSAALVTGNTVVMKPASPAAVTAFRLVELFEAAGLPVAVLNYLPGRGAEVGELLVKHPRVAMVAFTGSRAVGRRVNRLAAQEPTIQPALRKVLAEMGAKNAIIVDSDADLDEALKGIVQSAFGYAGQKCSAASRCIVLESIHERFTERLVEAVRGVKVGPAEESTTFVPPVIDKPAFDSIRQAIEVGKQEARCVLEVDVSQMIADTDGGYYIGPTVFTDVASDARIAQEELFGPVLAIIKARDIHHAIEIFNNTDFALTGGIYSRSPANIELARSACECGNLYINRKTTGSHVDLQPFGGFRMSGMGTKAGGPDYLVHFCEPRTITENTLRRGFAPSEEVVEALG
jgi:RHH-type proline utilization regulon transcriptional repressor/proline dehydrogenase/delta 1-pyrroline-5-carboxylate dehydrogenase